MGGPGVLDGARLGLTGREGTGPSDMVGDWQGLVRGEETGGRAKARTGRWLEMLRKDLPLPQHYSHPHHLRKRKVGHLNSTSTFSEISPRPPRPPV